jgi:hypothetical protein
MKKAATEAARQHASALVNVRLEVRKEFAERLKELQGRRIVTKLANTKAELTAKEQEL